MQTTETPWYVWLMLGAAGMYVVYGMMNNENEHDETDDEWEEI